MGILTLPLVTLSWEILHKVIIQLDILDWVVLPCLYFTKGNYILIILAWITFLVDVTQRTTSNAGTLHGPCSVGNL